MSDIVEIDWQVYDDLRLRKLAAKAEHLSHGDDPDAPVSVGKENWPPDYMEAKRFRQKMLETFKHDAHAIEHAKAYYAKNPVKFINHWCDTYDPRKAAMGLPVHFPLIMFPRQEDLVGFTEACFAGQANGLIEKTRDMGATWVCSAYSVWNWLFRPGSSTGWGSNKQDKVDKLGDASSIFEKIRMIIRGLPAPLKPKGLIENKHLFYMRCINPENGATITGEIGDQIGRGGRTGIYFVDEAAHLDRPESVEAALSETTRTRIDISSVSGLGTVFHRKREAGVEWEPGQEVVRGRTNIFVMDWSDHPEKSPEWYQERKEYYESSGLPHVFAREIDRDYAAAAEGIIIPADWVRSAIDAHKKLGFDDSGGAVAGLDVADAGMDRNAIAIRKGAVLKHVSEWSERDTGLTARRAVSLCEPYTSLSLQYDSIGVGAGVKAETNRLRDEGLLKPGIEIVPWNAGASVLHPFGRVIEGDENSPTNKDFYVNLKAQAWWMLRMRFERTHRAVTDAEYKWSAEDLISLPADDLPLLRKIQKELSQPTASRNPRMKLLVDKQPEGTNSPNLADAIVMAFWPWQSAEQPLIGTFGFQVV